MEDGSQVWSLIDVEDQSRIKSLIKNGRPYNLYNVISEGLTEEFFFSWYPAEEIENQLGLLNFPVDDWNIIFPFP
jgi:hypothetical protein